MIKILKDGFLFKKVIMANSKKRYSEIKVESYQRSKNDMDNSRRLADSMAGGTVHGV